MGVLKTLLGVVILLAIVVFGYWLYATYTISAADDEMWIKVNSNMPAPLRHWACAEVNGRFTEAQAPEGCGDIWESAAAPEAEAIEAEASEPAATPEVDTAEPATQPASGTSSTASTDADAETDTDAVNNATISPTPSDSPATVGTETDTTTTTPSGN